MSANPPLLARRAAAQVMEALADTRVVVINGARQVGKSTLADDVLTSFPGSVARYLDNPVTRVAAREDPVGFLKHNGLMLIDEVQRVPDLWLAIKDIVDREPRPGRFLLTGSARLLALRSLPDALPGRSETVELWPLSQGEIDGTADGFVDAAFALGADLCRQLGQSRPVVHRSEYLARIARGGYPEAVRRDAPRRRQRFFGNYVADLLSRDVSQVAEISRVEEMRRLLSLLAGQVGGVLNLSRLSSELGITVPTVRSYVAILETLFVLRLIPAYGGSASSRTTGAPKVAFVDSGLVSHLTSGVAADAVLGGLFENFVLGELGRQLTWAEIDARLFHFRDRDGHEVDGILEDSAGRVIGIEVKAGETVRGDDLKGLRLLERRLGDRFVAGFVLYSGDQQLTFGDKLGCLPISALWTAQSGADCC